MRLSTGTATSRTSTHDWTGKGNDPAADEQAANFILERSPETQGHDLSSNCSRTRSASSPPTGVVEQRHRSQAIAYTPFKHQVEKKRPWRTLTGRQQFYIDHPWLHRAGRSRSRSYKEPVPRRNIPLYWNTPHGRWSIHSTWRDHRAMLRLQRGVPIVYMHPDDARKRGLQTTTGCASTTRSASCVCRLQILPGEKPRPRDHVSRLGEISRLPAGRLAVAHLHQDQADPAHRQVRPRQLPPELLGPDRQQPRHQGGIGSHDDSGRSAGLRRTEGRQPCQNTNTQW